MAPDNRNARTSRNGLERALRDSAPEVRYPDRHREDLRLDLGKRFRRRSRARGIVAAALCLLVLAGSIHVSGLGASFFKLVQQGHYSDGRPRVVDLATGTRVGVPEHLGSDLSAEDLAYLTQKFEAIMAEDYVVLGVQGWSIQDVTFYSLAYDVQAGGDSTVYGHLISPLEEDDAMAALGFLEQFEEYHVDLVESGQAERLGQETRTLGEYVVDFVLWGHVYDDFGEVIYWDGTVRE